ncbi:ENO [Mytilus coruscus]|uniref:ENO n=1 Tax=Mytilus coruscus TaxID=42192 RepID=A0A6J8BGX9_MYTCO|nr:ENO [Mytilus coruscus]
MLATNWPCREFMILPTGMYRSIKTELSHAGNKLAMQEFMILPTGLSHAGNKLAMQEFMILPTGMYRSIKQERSHAGNKLAMQEFMILPTGIHDSTNWYVWSIKQELQSCWKQTGHAGILDSTNWSIKQDLVMLKQTGHLVMYRSINKDWPMRHAGDSTNWYVWVYKTGLGHAGNKLAMQGIHDSTNWSIKQELSHAGKQTGHAGIHDSTNWSIKQELSHAGNKLAMQEFMILPTELSHAGNKLAMTTNWYGYKQELSQEWPCRNDDSTNCHAVKLAMQEFMILPTGKYRSIKQELSHAGTNWPGIHDSTNWSINKNLSHAGNKLAMQEFMILPTGMYRSIKQGLQSCWKQSGHAGNHDSTNWYRSINKNFSHAGKQMPCRNS